MERKGFKLQKVREKLSLRRCGGSSIAEISGASSLLEDVQLEDTGASNEVVESRLVSKEPPGVKSESVAEDAPSS
ncbi:hypothetical protein RIF29_19470 [Crotalaria pallida]|uniref:Uncharacterized protein n=1 Tax=Crotalaria pallida TaxID=3830 RepID=A0AAN9I6J4_CROPI